MSIEAATSSMSVTSSASATSVSGTSSNSTNKTSTDSSFKDEMNKVSESEKSEKQEKTDVKTEEKKVEASKESDKKAKTEDKKAVNSKEEANVDSIQIALNEVNNMLSNDIRQMMNNSVSGLSSLENNNFLTYSFGFNSKNILSMNESDAQFFLNLTQNNDVSLQGINAQAQAMLDSGANAQEVDQGYQVSQTLLNALSEARQNNQPLRIDFDQNMSVIIRIGKDGVLSANFIPGDKAVEQFLRSNIQSLRDSFDENNLPYNDLSYSHSSKEQNQRRREEQKQQGE